MAPQSYFVVLSFACCTILSSSDALSCYQHDPTVTLSSAVNCETTSGGYPGCFKGEVIQTIDGIYYNMPKNYKYTERGCSQECNGAEMEASVQGMDLTVYCCYSNLCNAAAALSGKTTNAILVAAVFVVLFF